MWFWGEEARSGGARSESFFKPSLTWLKARNTEQSILLRSTAPNGEVWTIVTRMGTVLSEWPGFTPTSYLNMCSYGGFNVQLHRQLTLNCFPSLLCARRSSHRVLLSVTLSHWKLASSSMAIPIDKPQGLLIFVSLKEMSAQLLSQREVEEGWGGSITLMPCKH